MTKTELLALADALLGDRYRMSGVALRSAAAALREFAGMMDAGPEPIISMKRNEFDSLSLGAKSVLGTLIGGMKAPYRDELKSISRDDPRHPLYTHPPAPPTQEPVAWRYRWPATAQYLSTNWEYASTPEKPRLLEPSNGDRCELQPLYTHPPAPQRTPWPIRGVRVEGGTVIITVKGGNDAARWLCGEVLAEHGENK